MLGSIDPQSPGGETGRIGEIAGRLIAEMDLTSPVSVGQRDLLRQVLQFATDAEHTMMRQAQQLSSLRDSTLIDDMTGVPNKRGLERLFARSVAFSSRYGDTAVLVKVEIRDHEQTLNGLPPLQLSSTLYAVARTVSRLIRSSDVLARIGPREFAILLERCPRHRHRTRRARSAASLTRSTSRPRTGGSRCSSASGWLRFPAGDAGQRPGAGGTRHAAALSRAGLRSCWIAAAAVQPRDDGDASSETGLALASTGGFA
ncbi:GGDEF domain-containing protein [Hankyongella ginsenosidimutans]|uniref:GGDEF domain-containing protein n=1 Tax=Hankyongella ginsenosidimutans TaxID=1763828 RepID=A0A4D7C1M2_9SPHN|nr:GGDEF domain-containing protein [Hankyongella ginsenosidimutans]QCI78931.1 GGDEF domain-containing protein [Hankyongella ginsenosidimutans]